VLKSNSEKGRIGEKIALKYLESRNVEVIATNYRTRFGEIDIIARDKEYIVFIEVKLRQNSEHGLPREAVGKYKQKNIVKVARDFIMKNNLIDIDFRFDVIEILGTSVEYIENAFWDGN